MRLSAIADFSAVILSAAKDLLFLDKNTNA